MHKRSLDPSDAHNKKLSDEPEVSFICLPIVINNNSVIVVRKYSEPSDNSFVSCVYFVSKNFARRNGLTIIIMICELCTGYIKRKRPRDACKMFWARDKNHVRHRRPHV